MGDEKIYTAADVKRLLGQSMDTFRSSMIELIRECAVHEKYKGLSGELALQSVADKLEKLK